MFYMIYIYTDRPTIIPQTKDCKYDPSHFLFEFSFVVQFLYLYTSHALRSLDFGLGSTAFELPAQRKLSTEYSEENVDPWKHSLLRSYLSQWHTPIHACMDSHTGLILTYVPELSSSMQCRFLL